MDARGAQHLAARIRAGVRVGAEIELVRDDPSGPGLKAGDRGVVSEIEPSGRLIVSWERGFSLAIDPALTPFRRPAATGS